VGDGRFALAEQVRIGCGAWITSPLQGEGESEGFFSTPSAWRVKTLHLSPLPLPKGRGEKGWQVNFVYQSCPLRNTTFERGVLSTTLATEFVYRV
jgi:hypothetical protein